MTEKRVSIKKSQSKGANFKTDSLFLATFSPLNEKEERILIEDSEFREIAETEGAKIGKYHVENIYNVREKSLRQFTYLFLYCRDHCNIRIIEEDDLERIAIELFGCNREEAHDYAKCLKEIVA